MTTGRINQVTILRRGPKPLATRPEGPAELYYWRGENTAR